MTGEARVFIYHEAEDPLAVTDAYRLVSQRLATVPGMLGNELLHSVHDPKGFVVVSRWVDLNAFEEWEQGTSHRDSTAPLRPFRDTRMDRPFGVYQVHAAY